MEGGAEPQLIDGAGLEDCRIVGKRACVADEDVLLELLHPLQHQGHPSANGRVLAAVQHHPYEGRALPQIGVTIVVAVAGRREEQPHRTVFVRPTGTPMKSVP